MQNLRRWTSLLSRAGIAYAAIVMSIVDIDIPSSDMAATKKMTEHSSATASPGREAERPGAAPSESKADGG